MLKLIIKQNRKTMKAIVRTQEELIGLNREDLISILKQEFKVIDPISRVSKKDLVDRVLVEQENTFKAEAPKKNKSQLLRKEITRRCRANQTLNSGDLMQFMKTEHDIVMIRQFVVNVRNRHLKANPELLKA